MTWKEELKEAKLEAFRYARYELHMPIRTAMMFAKQAVEDKKQLELDMANEASRRSYEDLVYGR